MDRPLRYAPNHQSKDVADIATSTYALDLHGDITFLFYTACFYGWRIEK
jgi:hypothetical protein